MTPDEYERMKAAVLAIPDLEKRLAALDDLRELGEVAFQKSIARAREFMAQCDPETATVLEDVIAAFQADRDRLNQQYDEQEADLAKWREEQGVPKPTRKAN